MIDNKRARCLANRVLEGVQSLILADMLYHLALAENPGFAQRVILLHHTIGETEQHGIIGLGDIDVAATIEAMRTSVREGRTLSSALSANGPILPLTSALVALTPISPFRPRRWRGAILPDKARISLRVLDAAKRPVSAVADQREFRDVAEVSVAIDRARELTLLFDPEHALDDRITMEQFIA